MRPLFYIQVFMRFIDEVNITISSGKGGNGVVHFRREKYEEFGGPDGGDGGDGGNVYFKADENINTLVNFRGKKFYKAQDGEAGAGRQMSGKSGEDLIIKVPVGTIIKDIESNNILIDLSENNQEALIAEGGRGGLGNMNFKSSTNQAPRYAKEGKPCVTLDIYLELKLIADIALIGLPNAGKSTLISVISKAKPKIADYPFTTLEPNLGVVSHEDTSFVVADIPGLVENASQGKGLGIKFLKHIERTKAFVHLIDCSMLIEAYELYDAYTIIRQELERFNIDLINKREIICLTKIDAMSEDEIKTFHDFFENQLDKKILPISSVSGKNIDMLKHLMIQTLE